MDVSNFKRILSDVLHREVFKYNTQNDCHLQSVQKLKSVLTVNYITNNIPYNEFVEKHMNLNEPCLFGDWITTNWKSRKIWTKIVDGQVLPDFSDLLRECQSTTVPVADCRSQEFNSQPKTDWLLEDYICYITEHSTQDDSAPHSCLYLKDWHFFRVFPNYKVYHIPSFFASDWLFELWQQHLPPVQDDFRFVYIGPRGSWTPFHADVYRSYSWSANVCGRKKWLLFPPGQEEALKDANGHLPYDVTKCCLPDGVDVVEVIQEAGEVIFIPSGWFHQVHNLEDTISINHNWINGCNIQHVWRFLQEELENVEEEISDCRDGMSDAEWIDQCQLIMRVNSGMNLEQFFILLESITNLRLHSLNSTQLDGGCKDDLDEMTQRCRDAVKRLITLTFSDVTSDTLQALSDLCCVTPIFLEMSAYFKSKRSSRCRECTDNLQRILTCFDFVASQSC